MWRPSRDGKIDPTLPADPVTGRLLSIRLEKKGFRPKDLYLFTTLRDATAYPVAAIAALYGKRWQVERDYRHIKTVLEMDTFAVQSAALLRLELAAGLLTYNMVCGLMAQAAQQADLRPQQLSFARCWRRIRDTLCGGVPSWVSDPQTHVLQRLAHCRLHHQPWKVAHEPRNVRHQRQKYPTLRGDRDAARQEVLHTLGAVDPSSIDDSAGHDPPPAVSSATTDPPDEAPQEKPRLEVS